MCPYIEPTRNYATFARPDEDQALAADEMIKDPKTVENLQREGLLSDES